MNCTNCNSPLDPQARFCGVCGTSSVGTTIASGANHTMPAAPIGPRPIPIGEATLPSPPQQPMPPVVNPQSLSQQTYPTQDQYFTPTMPLSENGQLQQREHRGQRNLGGCLLRLITVLVLLFAALAGVWSFILQPYLHGMVINKLDTAMGQAVNQIPSLNQLPIPLPILPIPPPLKQLPPITDNSLTTVMKLSLSPSDPIKDLVFHITENGVRAEFNFQPNSLPIAIPCAISFVPTVDDQGNIIVKQMNIEGMANLIVTADDITPIVNRHLQDATKKLNYPISKIDLQPGAILITLK